MLQRRSVRRDSQRDCDGVGRHDHDGGRKDTPSAPGSPEEGEVPSRAPGQEADPVPTVDPPGRADLDPKFSARTAPAVPGQAPAVMPTGGLPSDDAPTATETTPASTTLAPSAPVVSQNGAPAAMLPPPPPPAAGWGDQLPAAAAAASAEGPPVQGGAVATDQRPAEAAATSSLDALLPSRDPFDAPADVGGAIAWPGSGLDDADALRAALLEEGQRLGEGLSDASGGLDLYGDLLQPGGTPASAEQPLRAAAPAALPISKMTQPAGGAAAAADPTAQEPQPVMAAEHGDRLSEVQPSAPQSAAGVGGPSDSACEPGGEAAAPEPEPLSAPAPASGAAGRAERAAARADAFRAPSDVGREDELSASEAEGGDDADGSEEEEEDDELAQARQEEERRRAVRDASASSAGV